MSRLARRSLAVITFALLAVACDDKDEAKDKPPAQAPAKAQTKAGDEAGPGRVWFVSPTDGAKVPRKFEVEFGLEGKTLAAAGGTTRDAKVGHHHIIIDGGPIPDMQIVPKDETHLHYGDGSSKTTLLLTPGEHKLTMQLADGAHQSYGPDWAETITVTVVDDAAAGGDGSGDGGGGSDGADAAEGGDAKADEAGG
jgi:hypothetical protein